MILECNQCGRDFVVHDCSEDKHIYCKMCGHVVKYAVVDGKTTQYGGVYYGQRTVRIYLSQSEYQVGDEDAVQE